MILFLFITFIAFSWTQGYSFKTTITFTVYDVSLNVTDVLIELDTSLMYDNGLLLENCEDLKFTTYNKGDIDSAIGLPFYLEGGCLTMRTRIWVRVDLTVELEGEIVEIFMFHGSSISSEQTTEAYYLNDPQRLHLDFDGHFIVMKQHTLAIEFDSCELEHYDLALEFHQNGQIYPRGATAKFLEGLSEEEDYYGGSTTHTHWVKGHFPSPTSASSYSPNLPPRIWAISLDDLPATPAPDYRTVADFNHTHTFFLPSIGDPVNHVPSGETGIAMKFCKSKDGKFEVETDIITFGTKWMHMVESKGWAPWDGVNGFRKGARKLDVDHSKRRDVEKTEGCSCHNHYLAAIGITSGGEEIGVGIGTTKTVYYDMYPAGHLNGIKILPDAQSALSHYETAIHHKIGVQTMDGNHDYKPAFTPLYNYKFNSKDAGIRSDPLLEEQIVMGWEPLDELINNDQRLPFGFNAEEPMVGKKEHLEKCGSRKHNHIHEGKSDVRVFTVLNNENGPGSVQVTACTEEEHLDWAMDCQHKGGDVVASVPLFTSDHYHTRHTNAEFIEVEDVDITPPFRYVQFIRRKTPPSGFSTLIAYEDYELIEWTCNGVSSWKHEEVCFGHGGCDSEDVCFCDDKNLFKYHGKDCQEHIPGTGFYDKKNVIFIDFQIPIKWIDLKHEEGFPCELIFHLESLALLGEKAKCRWKTKSMQEVGYIIIKNVEETDIKELYLRPLTKTEERLLEEITRRQSDINNVYMTEDGWIIAKITPMKSIWELYWPAFVFGPAGVLILGIVICFAISVGLFFVFVQNMRLKKYKDISQEVDLLLKEQKQEEEEGSTKIAELKINAELFETEYDDIKVLKKIGEGGSSSVVFKAKWKGKIIAFKCFKTQSICKSQQKFTEFEREVQILASNILQFYGATLKPPRVGILMQFCENGDVKEFLTRHTKQTKPYPLKEKLRIIEEITSSMKYLHSAKIIHRDLKNENVLITKDESSRLMDFGLSKVVERISQTKTKRIGTSVYMAPEVTRGDDYTEKCDVFSFAIMAYEIICDDFHPYGENAPYNLEFKVASNSEYRPVLHDEKFSKCKYIALLIERCWDHEGETRPSFAEVLQNIQKNKSFSSGLVTVEMPKNKKISTKEEILKEMEEFALENDALSKDIERMKGLLSSEKGIDV